MSEQVSIVASSEANENDKTVGNRWRWHHADKLFRAANGYRNFQVKNAATLAQEDTSIQVGKVTYRGDFEYAHQYVGRQLERAE